MLSEIEINPIPYESYQNLMKSVTYWWIFLYKLRWERKSNHLDNQDILFAFMNIASKSNPLKPLKCTLRKKWWSSKSWRQLPRSRLSAIVNCFNVRWLMQYSKYRIPPKTLARSHMQHMICIHSNSWECNFQRSKNLKRSPPGFKFKLHDRWVWIESLFIQSIVFF